MTEYGDGSQHAKACSGLVRYSVQSSNDSADLPKRPDGPGLGGESFNVRLTDVNETLTAPWPFEVSRTAGPGYFVLTKWCRPLKGPGYNLTLVGDTVGEG